MDTPSSESLPPPLSMTITGDFKVSHEVSLVPAPFCGVSSQEVASERSSPIAGWFFRMENPSRNG